MHEGAVDQGVFLADIGGEMLQDRSTPPDVAPTTKAYGSGSGHRTAPANHTSPDRECLDEHPVVTVP
jgi:hypothetical protein